MKPMILRSVGAGLMDGSASAMVADMATPTAREQLHELVKKQPDISATDAGRALGITRQRADKIAAEEGITLSKYVRKATPLVELSGTVERAARTLDNLRRHIDEAKTVERTLTKQLKAVKR